MNTGGCLCGKVRYQITGALEPVQFCHCEQCRKAQGTPFASNIPVSSSAFRFTEGKEVLSQYESTPGKIRAFCGHCGSPIFSQRATQPDQLRLRAGTLDGSPSLRLGFHIFTEHQAHWWQIDDDLPQHAEFPPQ